MTLIVALTGKESIWLLADRRLSVGTRTIRDDATKVMVLETDDGVAILGYAGLGATAIGNEPSQWMSNVLRGRKLPMELAMTVLADAAQRRLPKHLKQMSTGQQAAHFILAPAFVNGRRDLYSIELELSPDRKQNRFRHTHWRTDPGPPPVVAMTGSGALQLKGKGTWRREVLNLLRDYDRGRISAHTVADRLATVSLSVHQKDATVGPRCTVVWRTRKGGRHKQGSGHQLYTGALRENSNDAIPTIAGGFDVAAIGAVIMKAAGPGLLAALQSGTAPNPHNDAVDRAVAALPSDPDDELR